MPLIFLQKMVFSQAQTEPSSTDPVGELLQATKTPLIDERMQLDQYINAITLSQRHINVSGPKRAILWRQIGSYRLKAPLRPNKG